jgi:two-component system response regulator DesR
MIRILLVDDQPAVRQGLRMQLALETDWSVIAEADDGGPALALTAALRPDVVVMDAEMPGMGGIAVCAALRELTPASAVVILTFYDDAATRQRALDAGAAAFVGKSEGAEALTAAIRRAAARTPPAGRHTKA